ncbi:hypothetical protein D1B31_05670 [Neobacillus notoginsengisoli]|uniref:Uncharacterized protein n=1 Tax=Neobacillus notoginsengisoli TaxID=1578198 RepID=A0A417YX20_9BACI|nr:hypothetical protein [Neobacillus notoginsengisoli]RHW42124.1 hypothetical protein D1B31_05670 [Neobacillus notoginsengisoli]
MDRLKGLSLVGLGLVLVTSAYLDSPYSILNNDYYYKTEGVRQTNAFLQKPVRNLVEYEMKLEDIQQRNGLIIETYREYEVKKDNEGKIIESKPTSKLEEIKYRDAAFGLEP